MLKILQGKVQQYMNQELPDVQAGFRKGDNQKSNCQHPLDHRKSKIIKNIIIIYFCFIGYAKDFV